MSYVIDFGNTDEPIHTDSRYLLRLRGTKSGIVDLAGNTITNHNVDYNSTPSTLRDRRRNFTALKFNQSLNPFLHIPSLKNSIDSNEDFTLSVHVKNIIKPLNESENASYDLFNSSYGSETTQSRAYAESFNFYFIYPKNQDYFGYVGFYTYGSNLNDLAELYNTGYTFYDTSYHMALIRENNVIKVFVNGIQLSKTLTYSKTVHNKNTPINIGYNGAFQGNSLYMNCLIEDYCLIKGKALWTSNFTPPVSYLPDDLSNF